MTRIEVLERFTISGHGQIVEYRLLQGKVRLGETLVSEAFGDTWRVVSDQDHAFIDPPPPVGVSRPPFCFLRPAASLRQIEIGEILVEVADETDESIDTTKSETS